MGDLDCAKSKKGAACLNIMKKGAGPLREVFFEKAKNRVIGDSRYIYLFDTLYPITFNV
jgi:hypothetical protein